MHILHTALRSGRTLEICLIGLCCLLGCLVGASRTQAQTVLPATNETSLRDAIRTVSAAFAQGTAGGPYTIDLQGDVTLKRSLPSIRTESPGDGSAWVTIRGNGHQIDGNQTGRVFVIAAGIVAIDNLRILDARTRGGKGGALVMQTNPTIASGGGGGGGAAAECISPKARRVSSRRICCS